MEKLITFHISEKDKKIIEDNAKNMRLSVSSYCRIKILNGLDKIQ